MVQKELEALDASRQAALAELDRLAQACTDPSPQMVEQVSVAALLLEQALISMILVTVVARSEHVLRCLLHP